MIRAYLIPIGNVSHVAMLLFPYLYHQLIFFLLAALPIHPPCIAFLVSFLVQESSTWNNEDGHFVLLHGSFVLNKINCYITIVTVCACISKAAGGGTLGRNLRMSVLMKGPVKLQTVNSAALKKGINPNGTLRGSHGM